MYASVMTKSAYSTKVDEHSPKALSWISVNIPEQKPGYTCVSSCIAYSKDLEKETVCVFKI